MTRITGMAAVALLAGSLAACTKVQARTPAMHALNVPPPPSRVLIPVQLAEPEEPAPAPAAPPAASTPPRPRDGSTTARQTERPATATPAVTPSPDPPAAILQTTADTGALEQRTLALLAAAQRDLDRVHYADLSVDARAQYDRAKGFIRMARNALDIKNYMYAQQLADKAAAVANLLVKG